MLNTVGNSNTMVFVYLNIEQVNKSKYSIKDITGYTCIGHSPWMELAGLGITLGESVREW